MRFSAVSLGFHQYFRWVGCILVGASLVTAGQAQEVSRPKGDELGARKNPLKLSMVPSAESQKILSNMAPIARCLERESKYYFDVSVPSNYIVVVESLGTEKVDFAFINTFGYLLANDRYGAQALLKAKRHGHTTYNGQIIVRSDSGIKTLADLNGKKIAFTDPASTSGHILAKKLFLDNKVRPAEEVFAGKHDVVVSMVYQGQVDAGATYHSPKDPSGKIMDARSRVLTQFPDVESKVKILELTPSIPNDPIVARKGLTEEMKSRVKNAFLVCVKEHTDAFKGVNNSTDLAEVSDSEYDTLRETVKQLKLNIGESLK